MDLYIIPQIKEIVGLYSHPQLLNQNKKTKKRKGGKRWFNSFLAVFCIKFGKRIQRRYEKHSYCVPSQHATKLLL